MTQTRTETDSFGPLEVPTDRYWGAQTQRSLSNFKISWEKQPAAIIRALGAVKLATARVNMREGRLDESSAHLTAALRGGQGTHQPGGTCADDHNVERAHDPETAKAPGVRGFREERMKGLEPSTFCMATAQESTEWLWSAAAGSIKFRSIGSFQGTLVRCVVRRTADQVA